MKTFFKLGLVGALVLSAAGTAHADLWAFSRANCGNNESITWHGAIREPLYVTSRHALWLNFQHCVSSTGASCNLFPTPGLVRTRRAAAVHWGEAPTGSTAWYVYGNHYRVTSRGVWYLWRNTSAFGCNLSHS